MFDKNKFMKKLLCPYCGEQEYRQVNTFYDDEYLCEGLKCFICKRSWIAIYTLHDVTEIKDMGGIL